MIRTATFKQCASKQSENQHISHPCFIKVVSSQAVSDSAANFAERLSGRGFMFTGMWLALSNCAIVTVTDSSVYQNRLERSIEPTINRSGRRNRLDWLHESEKLVCQLWQETQWQSAITA